MTRKLLFALAPILAIALLSGDADGQDGWIQLFNGRDLAGWKTHPSQPGNWRVADGVLIGTGPAVSHLYSTRGDIKDFHLRAETRINRAGNGGLYVRAPFGPFEDFERPRGYEAQINLAADNPRTGSLFANNKPVIHVKDALVKPGEWFALEVIAQGERIVVKVNGQTTADYTDEVRLNKSGHIALQVWMPETVTEFRKIEIKGPGVVEIVEKAPLKPAPVVPKVAGVLPEEQEMLKLINDFRAENGLAPLKINATMCLVARQHSENMAKQDKLDHVLDEKGPGDRARAGGLRGGFGENIAAGSRGTVAGFHKLWVDSPGHKANMLGDYAEMGVGFATGEGGRSHWYTTLFGGKQ